MSSFSITNINIDARKDIPVIEFSRAIPQPPAGSISETALKSIFLRSGEKVYVIKSVYNQMISKALGSQRDLPAGIQRTHKVVLEALNMATEEVEIFDLFHICKRLESLQKYVDTLKICDPSKKLTLQNEEQLKLIITELSQLETSIYSFPDDCGKHLLERIRELFTQIGPFAPLLSGYQAASAAAGVGEAFNLAIEETLALQKKGTPIPTQSGIGTQAVVIGEKSVFKSSDLRSRWEERVTQNIAHLLYPRSVTNAFFFPARINPQKLGITPQIDPEILASGFSSISEVVKTSSDFQTRLIDHIEDKNTRLLVRKLIEVDASMISPKLQSLMNERSEAEKNLIFFEDTEFEILEKGASKWQRVSFSELRKLYYSESIKEGTSIKAVTLRPSFPLGESFEKYCLKNTNFFNALSYDPTAMKLKIDQANLPNFYFIPDLRGPLDHKTQKALLETCPNEWIYQDSLGNWIFLDSFEKLQELWNNGIISRDTFIKQFDLPMNIEKLENKDVGEWQFYNLKSQSWEDSNSKLLHSLPPQTKVRAVIRSSVGQMTNPNLLLILNRNIDINHFYRECEKQIWEYFVNNDWVSVDFKQLQILWLSRDINGATPIRPSSKEKFILASAKGFLLLTALDVSWKLITPNIFQLHKSDISPLNKVSAKPFESMSTVYELSEKNPSFLEFLLEHLQPESEAALVFTGIQQFMDLHTKNIGIQSDLTLEEYEKMLKMGLHTNIKITVNPQTKLIIFDLDRVAGESNLLQRRLRIFKDGQAFVEHNIPIRSAFLSSNFRDRPLQPATIQLLLDGSKERRDKLVNWIEGKNASIRNFISNQIQFDNYINAFLAEDPALYSFAEYQKTHNHLNISIDLPRNAFAEKISVLNDKYKPFWDFIQKELQSYTVTLRDILKEDGTKKSSEEIWQAIAKRYKCTVEELKKMNEALPAFKVQAKIKVPSPLKTPLNVNSEASKAERIRFAQQSFPKITPLQKQSLLERYDNLTQYLTEFAKIERLVFTDSIKEIDAAIEFIKGFIKYNSPLPSTDKEAYIDELNGFQFEFSILDSRDRDFSNKFQKLKTKIQKLLNGLKGSTTPTYFNTLKVMYPLLGDVLFLISYLTDSNKDAGTIVGHFGYPLEWILNVANEKLSGFSADDRMGHPLQEAISLIEKQLAAVKTPHLGFNVVEKDATHKEAYNKFRIYLGMPPIP